MNKKIKLIFLLVLIPLTLVLSYLGFSSISKDKYLIDEVSLRKVCFFQGVIKDYNQFDTECSKFGVGLVIKKKYVSDENSKRVLFNSIEPGIKGLKDSILSFNILGIKGNDKVILNDYLFHQKGELSISFSSFIEELKNNEREYTGIRLDGVEVFFELKGFSSDEFDDMNFNYVLNI
jgi:hypothetical protein